MALWTLLLVLVLAGADDTLAEGNVTSWCAAPGIFCLGCDRLGVCVETSPGVFREFEMAQCDQDAPCSESLKNCGEKTSWCSSPGGHDALLCQSPGVWPDPFDCNVFWTCGDPDPPTQMDYSPEARNVCPAGTAFDALTSRCSLSVDEAACGDTQYPLPACDPQTVTAAPSDRDPNLYFVCVGGVARLYRCQEGFEYSNETWACVRANGTDPSTTPAPPSGFQCPGVGRYPDLDSCSRYYDCSDTAHPRLAACPWPKYFHRDRLTCKMGSCPYQ